jgi:HK97 family phage portal protein
MSGKKDIFHRVRDAVQFLAAAGTWRPQTINELDQWMEAMAWGGASASGANVNGETANNFAAFFSGVFQICQTIASCTTHLYQEVSEDRRRKWKQHPLYRVLTIQANPRTDAFTMKQTLQYHAMVWGNGYAYIERDGAGRPRALYLINTERMKPFLTDEKALRYRYRDRANGEHIYRPDEIFHLAGFGFNGIEGYSLLRIHRDVIGLGLSQQEFTGRFIDNGAHVGGLLTTEKALSEDARKRLKSSFNEYHSGAANAGKFAVLEEGMDYKPLTMPMKDAQFLESKMFQIQEIARILNISPYKLKDYSHATFSNVEHLGIEYATDTIRPWAERWEAAIKAQLFSEREQEYAHVEFDLSSIQRGDSKTMNEALQIARYGGWMNGDEIRAKLGMNPIGGRVGESFWMPTNMGDAAQMTREEQADAVSQ